MQHTFLKLDSQIPVGIPYHSTNIGNSLTDTLVIVAKVGRWFIVSSLLRIRFI